MQMNTKEMLPVILASSMLSLYVAVDWNDNAVVGTFKHRAYLKDKNCDFHTAVNSC